MSKKVKILAISSAVLTTLAIALFFVFNKKPQQQQEEKTYVVGLDATFVPMGFMENNEIVGFDIDLAKAVAEEAGIKLEFRPINWDSKEIELNSGKIDMIWNGLSYTKERAEKMTLSKPYMKNEQVVIVRKDSKIKNLEDLKGLKLCVQKDSTGYEALKKHSIYSKVKEIIQLDSMADCLTEVKQNHCDACVVDSVIFKYMANKNNLEQDYKILKNDPLSKEDYVIAFGKNNAKLLEKIEPALEKLMMSGKTREISIKWFKEDLVCFKR